MKKIIAVAFVIGIVIGIFQFFWTYERTMQRIEKISANAICQAMSPECGVCMYEVRDNKCYEPAYTQKFRGFPFSSGSYGYDSRINTTPFLIANIFIWALGLPLLVYLAIKIKHKFNKV